MAPKVRRLLALSGMSLLVFAGIAAAWRLIPAVPDVDSAVAANLHRYAVDSPAAVRTMLGVTSLGAAPFLVWFSAIVTALLLLRGRWRLATAWIVVQLIALVLIQYSKLAFDRPRPPFNGSFVTEDSLSFPSGHSLGSMATFGLLAYLLIIGVRPSAGRRIGVACCVVLIGLIGFSRMFLGVHYLTDVLGGFALGLAWLLFALAAIEDLRFHVGRSAGNMGQYGGTSAVTVIDS